MKKLTIAIISILFCSNVFAQSTVKELLEAINTPLTETEYRYISKGLLDDVNMGKDIKAGYQVKAIPNAPGVTQNGFYGTTSFKVFGFYKVGSPKPIALALKFIRTGKQQNFVCIPKIGTDDVIVQNCKTDFNNCFDNKNSISVSLCFNALQYIVTYQQ